ncbi:MAG: dihydroxyacetone kinase subunit DhaK [Rhodopila sp.]
MNGAPESGRCEQVAPRPTCERIGYAGLYVTSLDMAGCSLTVSLLDEAMEALWDAPVNTSALRW